VKAIVPGLGRLRPLHRHRLSPAASSWTGYVKWWNALDRRLDRKDVCALAPIVRVDCTQLKAALTGVKPVDGDTAGRQLRQAIAQHARNIDVYATGRRVAFRDDRFRHPTSASTSRPKTPETRP